jgi:hypothetical protein
VEVLLQHEAVSERELVTKHWASVLKNSQGAEDDQVEGVLSPHRTYGLAAWLEMHAVQVLHGYHEYQASFH